MDINTILDKIITYGATARDPRRSAGAVENHVQESIDSGACTTCGMDLRFLGAKEFGPRSVQFQYKVRDHIVSHVRDKAEFK